MKKLDLTGQRFGRLIAVSPTKKGQKTAWLCRCDCGNEKIIVTASLRNGSTQSCGCLHKESVIRLNASKKKDIPTNTKFGRLTVLKEGGRTNKGLVQWVCQCDCGKQILVSGADLRSGGRSSCGCLRSFGEDKMVGLLEEMDLNFSREFTFNDLRSNSKNKLRFDFAIFENNTLSYLIEYDGEQHFRETGWGTYEGTKIRDKVKNKYCLSNNIPLIRIPYNTPFVKADLILPSKFEVKEDES